MEQADLYEAFDDFLLTKFEHWLFAHEIEDLQNVQPVTDFVRWVREDVKKDLNAKRAPDGKSFLERREERKSNEVSKVREGTNPP